MRNTSLLGAVMLVACFATVDLSDAQAQGIHIGGRGVHLDIGNPHGYHWGHGGGYGHYGRYPHRSYHHGNWAGGHVWHDTSHWDYHPGGYYRHRNHYHYAPGHYDFHHDGHWDHLHH